MFCRAEVCLLMVWAKSVSHVASIVICGTSSPATSTRAGPTVTPYSEGWPKIPLHSPCDSLYSQACTCVHDRERRLGSNLASPACTPQPHVPMAESPLDFVRRNAQLFARVGSVVATYRTRGNDRFGPYYRLIYRQDQRQRSRYLGRSEELAKQVRELLRQLQKPRDDRLAIQRSHRLRKATLLRLKREWQQVIRAYGLQPHGWTVRGLRARGWPRIDKVHFRKKPDSNHATTTQYRPNNDRAAQLVPTTRSHRSSPAPPAILPVASRRCPTRTDGSTAPKPPVPPAILPDAPPRCTTHKRLSTSPM